MIQNYFLFRFYGYFLPFKRYKSHSLEFQHIKAHMYKKLNVFTFNTVYLSIRISSSMQLVIFVASTFHLIETLKYWNSFGFFKLTLRWTGPNNGYRTLVPNTSKMVNNNTVLDKLPLFLTCNPKSIICIT